MGKQRVPVLTPGLQPALGVSDPLRHFCWDVSVARQSAHLKSVPSPTPPTLGATSVPRLPGTRFWSADWFRCHYLTLL